MSQSFTGRGVHDSQLRQMLAAADRNMDLLDGASTDSRGVQSAPGSDDGGERTARAEETTPTGSDDDFDANNRKLRASHSTFRTQAARYKTELAKAKETFAHERTDMMDQLEAAHHRHLMLEQKMAALQAGHSDELRRVHAQTRDDLEILHARVGVIESTPPPHTQIVHMVRAAFEAATASEITEEQYTQLCTVPHDRLSPEDLAVIKIYEHVAPIRRRCDAQLRQIARISEAGAALEQALGHAAAEAERLAAGKITAEAALARIRNEDARMARIDELEQKLNEVTEDAARSHALCTELETRLAVCNDARVAAEMAAADALKRLDIVQLDKEHLTRANIDLQKANDHAMVQLREQQATAGKLEKSREEAYQKLLEVKAELSGESERDIQRQMAEIRDKNAAELAELRSQAHLMYEYESRGYRNERDAAVAARRQLEVSYAEQADRTEGLTAAYNELQLTSESRISDLSAQLRVKTFECARVELLLEEAQASLAAANLESQKQREKVAVATQEYAALKWATDARIAALEARQGHDNETFEAYEQMERELDEVVMQAADASDPSDTLMGYGRHMPGAAKRRLKQGVTLARKLLATQRELKRVGEDAAAHQARSEQLEAELSRANELLDIVHKQPHSVLVAELRENERALRKAREELSARIVVAERLERENIELQRVQNAMSADLERLLDSEREIDELRALVSEIREATASAAAEDNVHSTGVKSTRSGARKDRVRLPATRLEGRKARVEWK